MSSHVQQRPLNMRPRRLKLRSRGGCMNCKLRRRKCDEVKPSCGKCQQLGCECQWLDESSSTEQREWFERRKLQNKQVQLEIRSDEVDSSPDSAPRCLIADHGDVRISYLLDRLFKGANRPCAGAGGHSLTVRTELHFATDTSSLTWSCLAAMAMVYWGTMQNDPSTLLSGLQAKIISLARMRAALSEDITSFSGDLVAAVALARLFETMLPDSQTQWVIHAQGLTRLFDSMGPHAFRTPAMRRLVENNRWVMITSASALRKPTVLDSAEWRTIPWVNAAHKDMLQRLLDIYAKVPGIHALWDKHAKPRSEERQAVAEAKLISQVRQMLLDMYLWRTSVDDDIEQSVDIWESADESVACPWQIAVSFTELHHAYAIALYNMMILLLSRYVNKFPEAGNILAGPEKSYQGRLLRSSLLPLRNLTETTITAADEIAMVLPWAMQDRFRGAGTMYMGGPAHICYLFWQRSDPIKFKWFEQALHQVNTSWNSLLLLDLDLLR